MNKYTIFPIISKFLSKRNFWIYAHTPQNQVVNKNLVTKHSLNFSVKENGKKIKLSAEIAVIINKENMSSLYGGDFSLVKKQTRSFSLILNHIKNEISTLSNSLSIDKLSNSLSMDNLPKEMTKFEKNLNENVSFYDYQLYNYKLFLEPDFDRRVVIYEKQLPY